MTRIPTKLAEELGMKKKVVESYLKSEDVSALISGMDSKYSYSKVYKILYNRIYYETLEIADEK